VLHSNPPSKKEFSLRCDGKLLVILLGGGTKRRQQSDIQTALRHWRSYKARKAAGRTKRN
jgi:hypothetical protein